MRQPARARAGLAFPSAVRACRRAASLRGLAALAGTLALLAAGPSAAHTRSQSFSSWEIRGGEVAVVFGAPAYEATRLAAAGGAGGDLASLLRDHLASHLAVERGGTGCAASGSPRSLAARPGTLRLEQRFSCAGEGELRIRNDAFFDLAPSHVHYARVRLGEGAPVEHLFDDARRELALGGADAKAARGASFPEYVLLGAAHIAGGADHVAFLLALLLASRRLRDLVFLASGFTLGHSLTLALAVTGVLRPNGAVVESLIGFTIALVAAETLAARAGVVRRLALGAALALAALALLPGSSGIALPARTSLGLALFTLCYLPLASAREEAARLRPALTLAFGLVHGFGFAGVLLDVGLPPGRLVGALLGFNLGVELGQLVLVSGLWLLGGLAAARLLRRGRAELAADALCAALLGLGVFWFVERSLGS